MVAYSVSRVRVTEVGEAKESQNWKRREKKRRRRKGKRKKKGKKKEKKKRKNPRKRGWRRNDRQWKEDEDDILDCVKGSHSESEFGFNIVVLLQVISEALWKNK